jgi:hypothetical protein
MPSSRREFRRFLRRVAAPGQEKRVAESWLLPCAVSPCCPLRLKVLAWPRNRPREELRRLLVRSIGFLDHTAGFDGPFFSLPFVRICNKPLCRNKISLPRRRDCATVQLCNCAKGGRGVRFGVRTGDKACHRSGVGCARTAPSAVLRRDCMAAFSPIYPLCAKA